MSRMRVVLAFAFALATAVPAVARAETPERYQEIRIRWPNQAGLELIRSMPDLEVVRVVPGQFVQYVSRPSLTQRFRDAGLDPEIVHDDLEAHYRSQLTGVGFGSYYTYSECVDALDSLHAAYPSITTAKFSIGTSLEGRTIWCMKVSDNPGVDENEPEVLFDALHHAREPGANAVVMDFIRFLGSHYGTDPEATFIVNQREVFVVPVVNPDGYVYNETTNPSGGGMWRKNRRDYAGSCDGVDLNRNYSFHWGGGGSSGNPCDDTYRGPSAFSEPETQALRDFIISRRFVTHNSYHTVAALTLFPWGWTGTTVPELPLWNTMGQHMTAENGYIYGSAYTTLYQADGVAFDWAYGDTLAKPKIYSFTTEVGGSGFWPAEAEIPGLTAENLASNIYLAMAAGAFVTTTASSVIGGDGNGRLDPGESAGLVLTLANLGVITAASAVDITIRSSDPYVQIQDAVATVGTIGAGGTATNGSDPLEVVVDPAAPQGHRVTFDVAIRWAAGGANDESVSLTVGSLPVLVSDNFESGNNGWSQDPSHTATTGAWVLIDPNATTYQPGDDTTPAPGVTAWITAQNSAEGTDDVDGGVSAMRSPVWDLSGHARVKLAMNWFFGQRDAADDSGDFFKVQLSNNGGATWPATLVSVGDAYHAATWQPAEWNLEDFLPVTNQMRIRVQAADGTVSGDIIEGGIDDLVISDGGSGNQPPGIPAYASPADGATLGTPTPLLVVNATTDPEGSPVTYSFRVYSDALLTTPVRAVDGIVAGGAFDQASWRVSPPLPAGATYHWRVFASDGTLRGTFTTPRSFTVQAGASVADPGSGDVAVFQAAAPNPFNARTSVRFSMASEGRVRADVFDPAGRRVRSLYRGVLPAGFQTLTWDGADESGAPVRAGVYFMVVDTGTHRENIKLTLIR